MLPKVSFLKQAPASPKVFGYDLRVASELGDANSRFPRWTVSDWNMRNEEVRRKEAKKMEALKRNTCAQFEFESFFLTKK